MSSFWDRVDKVNEQKKTEEEEEKKKQQEKSSSSFWDRVDKVNSGDIVVNSSMSVEDVTNWMSGASNVGQKAYNFLKTDGYKLDDKYESEINSYLDQADYVAQYLRANKKSIANYDELISSHYDTVNYLKSLRDGIGKSNEYYSKWNTDELVEKHGSAEEAYKYDERAYGYSKKYEGKTSTELQDLIDTMEDGEEKEWLTSYVDYVERQKLLTVGDSTSANYDKDFDKFVKTGKEYANLTEKEYNILTSEYDDAYFNAETKEERDDADAKRRALKARWDAQIRFKSGLSSLTKEEQEVYYYYLGKDAETGTTVSTDAFYKALTGKNNSHLEYFNPSKLFEDGYQVGDISLAVLGTVADVGVQMTKGAVRMGEGIYDLGAYGVAQVSDWLGYDETADNIREHAMWSATDASFAPIDDYLNQASVLGRTTESILEGTGQAAALALTVNAGAALFGLGSTGTTVLSSLLTFSSSTGHGITEAYEGGATDGEAWAYGSIAGLADTVSELMWGGLGKFTNAVGLGKSAIGFDELVSKNVSKVFSGTFGRNLAQYAVSGAFEGLEEVLAGFGQAFAKSITYMSEKDFADIINDENLLEQFVVGMFTSYLMQSVDLVSDTKAGRDLITGLTDNESFLLDTEFNGYIQESKAEGYDLSKKQQNELYEKAKGIIRNVNKKRAKEAAQVTRDATKAAKELGIPTSNVQHATAQPLTRDEVREALAANNSLITAEDTKKIQSAAEERLKSLGQTENISQIAELATKRALGQRLTRSEKSILANSEYGARVANELVPDNIMSGEYTTEWAEGIGTKQVNAFEYNIKNIAEQMANMNNASTYKSLEERVGKDVKGNVSKTGKATVRSSGKEISLDKAEVVSFDKDDMTIRVDGEDVKVSDIDFADEGQSYLFSAVSKIENITPGDAQVIIRDYDPSSGLSVGEYLNGVDEAYTYGYHRYSEADLKAGQFAPKLSDKLAMSAYQLGRTARKNGNDARKAKFKRMRTAAEIKSERVVTAGKVNETKEMTITYNEGNGVVKDLKQTGIKLPEKQSGGVAVAKMLHRLGLGTNFEFFSSYLSKKLKDKNGKPARVFLNDQGVEELAPSGVYMVSDGTIRVDLNAYSGRGFTLYALAHELTHFIQEWSVERYEVLAEYLVSTYEKTGMTMHQRVLREQARLKGIRGKDISYNEAYDEVVANAMMKMFDDGKLVERLTDLKVKDAKLARKLWEGFKRILNKLLGVYQKNPGLFYDTYDLMQMKEDFEVLQGMFAEALVEASDNYQASLTVSEGQTLAESSKETGIQQSSQKTDLDKNKNRASSDSPLTRRSVKQRSVGSTHEKMSSTAAAEILGIENIAKQSDSVKKAIKVLGEFYVSVDTKKPVLGFKKTISASNLKGSLIAQNILKREGTSGSAYRYDNGHALRISNHSANANNFVGDGEHLSIALFERGKMNDFVDGESNVIEAVFRQRYLDDNPEALKQVIHDIAHFIVDGEYHDTAGAMLYNFSGTEAFKAQAKQRMETDGATRKQQDELYSSQETDLDTKTHLYAYDRLVSKPDMRVTTVDVNVPKTRADVVYQAKQNAAKVGKFDPKTGSVSVYVDDINENVVLGTPGLKHGLEARREENAIVTLKAGEILKHSIRINELTPKKDTVDGSYVLVGASKSDDGSFYIVRSVVNKVSHNLVSMDVLYAINAKKWNRSSLMLPGFQGPVTDSTISIAELLDLVNQYFPDVLPEDVLKHYGYDARPEGDLGKDVLYSTQETDNISNRDMLANALKGLAKDSKEAAKIREYQGRILLLNEQEAKLQKLNAEIQKITFGTKGKRDMQRLRQLQAEAKNTAEAINRHDRELLSLEASEPLRKVIEREQKKAAQKTKEHVKQIQENKKLRAEQAEYRHKIQNFKKKLESKLLRPTDSQYIPVDLIGAMIEVCDLIDTDTNLYKADGSINKAQVKRDETKEKLQSLKDEYEKLKTNSDPIYAGEFDEVVYAYLTELKEKFSVKSLKDMSSFELAEMYEILRAIDETLADARKLIGWGDAENVYEAGDSIVAEQNAITQKRKHGKRNAAQKGFDKIDNLSLSPVRNVERMSGYDQDSTLLKLFKKFEQGIRKKNFFVMNAYKSFEELTSGKEYDDAMYKEFGGKKYTDVKGREFGVSKMQMMQAILSLERETANKNLHHIEKGGFTFADLDKLRKGNLKDAVSAENSHRVPAAVEMVAQFQEDLRGDKWCQDYMAAAREFFNGMAKDAINETSIALKHRIIAKDKNYIPFEVDTNFLNTEITDMDAIQKTINSYGMLKETKNNAPQALYITGLNNILDRHIEQVGNVYGLAIEVRNFNRVWNAKSKDANGNDTTVKDSIDANWGKDGVKNIEQAVKDIQGQRVRERNALYDKVKSGYIRATFTLNLSVVTKQIGSLFASTSMLQWRDPARMIGNLVYTMAKHKEIAAEVDKYTASAWMRRQGLSDAELHTLMTESRKTRFGRLMAKAPAIINPTKWISAMDHTVALSLWKYAKQDTAKRTGLEGEELLKATAEFYDEVVENTQSMTDVLHRPEIQKSGNVMAETFGMFKTDLYQMSGQLQATAGRYMANKSKENGRALVRTVYSIAMSAIWTSLMTAVWAILRYKVDPYRDEDDELTFESWLKRIGADLSGDIMGYIFPILGGEIMETFENIMYGESYDILDSHAITVINNLYSAMITIGTSVKDGEWPELSDMRKLTANALQCFGIPANNILRALDAVQLHAEDIANGEFLSFNAGNDSKTDKLYKAIIRGDTAYEGRIKSTYKTSTAYHTAVRKALRENDSRIQDAAQAQISGDPSERVRISRLIIADGFDQDDVVMAINAEINAMTPDDDSGTSASKMKGFYSVDDFVREYANGDKTSANAAKNDIISTYMANGYTKDAAEKRFMSNVTGSIEDAYSSGLLTETRAKKMLQEYAGKDEDEAASKVDYWAFCEKYPAYKDVFTESHLQNYNEYAKSAGISVATYARYISGTKGLSTKKQVTNYIHSLPLTKKQKDALYLARGYAQSTLWDTPWHN